MRQHCQIAARKARCFGLLASPMCLQVCLRSIRARSRAVPLRLTTRLLPADGDGAISFQEYKQVVAADPGLFSKQSP